MKNHRIKIPLPTISTREEAEATLNELALIANNQRRLIAQRDAEVLAINSKYEAGLAACEEDLKAKTELLRAWAESHPEQFPKGRKSIDLTAGTLGFRTGTPKLTLLNRSFKWDKVLENIRAFLPQFIRTKDEVDKEAIIAHRDTLNLASYGLKIVQEESFFVEPHLTDVESRQTIAA